MATNLNYRRSGVTYQINLYDYQVDDWDSTLRIYDGSSEKYIPADTNTGHANASHMRVRDGGVTHAVLSEKDDAGMYTWGANSSGQGGRLDKQNRSSPTQMNTGAIWQSVSCGRSFSVFVKDNGTIWSCGSNSFGVLGHGSASTLDSQSSPTQIGALSNWVSASCGNWHTVTIKSDGTVWSWGHNSYGQVGDSSIEHRSSPVRASGASGWDQVSAGYYHTAGIRNGTLWTWGRNHYGQLGTGNRTDRSSPVQLGSDIDWSYIHCGISSTFGIKTDGSLWSWGQNSFGLLGHGDETDRSSPVRVGALTGWTSVYGGWHILGIRSGRVYAWGDNGFGELMQGDSGSTTRRSSPTQVGTATNWTRALGGDGVSLIMNSSNQLYGAGYGYYGAQGVGDRENHSSPVLSGTYAGWSLLEQARMYSSAGTAFMELP